MSKKDKNIHSNSGSAITTVMFLVLFMMVGALAFMKRSTTNLIFSGLKNDQVSTEYQVQAAYESAKSKIIRATDPANMRLTGDLHLVGGPTIESFQNISDTYSPNQIDFLSDLIVQQAYVGNTLNTAHEFANFSTAFPTSWTDPVSSDGQYVEVQYTFSPIAMYSQASPQQLKFEYEYRIQVRAYGQARYQSVGAEDAGIIEISVEGAPFSQYAAFMNSMVNQNGQIMVFAGGDTSSQIQEIYTGPVHVNGTPYFYGDPIFRDQFTSAALEVNWLQFSTTNYSGTANFQDDSTGGADSLTMPSTIYNTLRLAAGDTSNTASTNNTTVTNAELRGFLATHANGTVTAGSSAVPEGIYVPVDNGGSLNPTGGVFVEGDANIQLNVVQGSSDFSTTQWGQMSPTYQSCKFQKVSITHATAGIDARDIYIGDDPCDITYVYNATNTSETPVLLNGRLNGNIHVDGKIDQLGGASRTRPAIVTDFGMTISATKDVRINNDLQYEDAYYVSITNDGTEGTTTVATPTGQSGGSGIAPTSADISPKVPSDSHTVLGILSTQRNVYLRSDAPANINVHGAIYAGNSDYYDAGTGYGCGSSGASTQGCGFGYESWDTATGKGNFKLLGSLSQYKAQTTGLLGTTPTGYANRNFYDSRFRSSINPPGFPLSTSPRVVASVKPFRTWRLSQATP